MFTGDTFDKLHNKNGFPYTRTAKQTNLSTFCKWGKEVNDLQAGLKYFGCRLSLLKRRRLTMNGITVFCFNFTNCV